MMTLFAFALLTFTLWILVRAMAKAYDAEMQREQELLDHYDQFLESTFHPIEEDEQ